MRSAPRAARRGPRRAPRRRRGSPPARRERRRQRPPRAAARAAASAAARGIRAASTSSASRWAELKKVEWPTQPQLIQGTVVVLVACVIVGVYLWGADQIFQRLVQNVFLGQ